MEEEKLQKEQKEIAQKRDEIDRLQTNLQKTEQELKDKQEDLDRHKIFSTFLQSVVNDKSGDNEGFSEIIDLQNRFISLKDENKQLMKRKAHINQLMEEARAQEKDKLNQLKNTLYDQQRKMQVIQADIESISQANSVLEQDFEYEINKKN